MQGQAARPEGRHNWETKGSPKMQTTTTADIETATTEQIADEVAKNLAAAIMRGASAESLADLDESWHGDVKDAVEALDDFYEREANPEPHLLQDVLMLNKQSGAVWVSRMSSNEQFAGETNGTLVRLAERDGEASTLRMYGPAEGVEFPDSADEFRVIFAWEIADALIKNLEN
jgi:hypothetical protein